MLWYDASIRLVINFCNHEVLSSCPLSSNGHFCDIKCESFVNVNCQKEPTFSPKKSPLSPFIKFLHPSLQKLDELLKKCNRYD